MLYKKGIKIWEIIYSSNQINKETYIKIKDQILE